MEFGGLLKRRNLHFQRHVGVGGDVHVAEGEAVFGLPFVRRLPGGALLGRRQRHIGDFLFGREAEDDVVHLIGNFELAAEVVPVEAEVQPQVIDVV